MRGGYKTYFEARDRLRWLGAKRVDSPDTSSLLPGWHEVVVHDVQWRTRDVVRRGARMEARAFGQLAGELEELTVVFRSASADRFVTCRPRPYGRLHDQLSDTCSWRRGTDPSNLLKCRVRVFVAEWSGYCSVWKLTDGSLAVVDGTGNEVFAAKEARSAFEEADRLNDGREHVRVTDIRRA